jgi:phosphonate transport system substrate-binding protein
MKAMRPGLLAAIVCAIALALPATATAGKKISILPRFAADVLLAQITPLKDYLSETVGEEIEVVLTRDFKEYENRINSGEIDIALSNPNVYPLTSGGHEAIAMLSEKQGGERLRGVIVTRADSDIASIEDLKNRSVILVGKSATGGYLSQKVTLAEAGIDVNQDLKLQEARDNKAENALLAVYYGDADAAFVGELALSSADNFIPPSQLRVIRRTAWMPNFALSVKRDLPPKVKERIRSAILALKPGEPVLEALKAKGFVEATDADYDVVRQALGLPIPAR